VATEIPDRLRADVRLRARFRCEYCLIHEADAGFSHQVDHIISRKHGGATDASNLAYCCILCNRHKGSDVAKVDPRTGRPVRLFHPRLDRWLDHFRLEGAVIEPLTAEGSATCRLLRLNTAERQAERRAPRR